MRNVNRMPLAEIEREITSLESLPINQRTVEITQRLESLKNAAGVIKHGKVW